MIPCSLADSYNLSEQHAAFIFRIKASLIFKFEAVGSSETLITTYQTAWCHNCEDDSLGRICLASFIYVLVCIMGVCLARTGQKMHVLLDI
jgi:hypothetical protein